MKSSTPLVLAVPALALILGLTILPGCGNGDKPQSQSSPSPAGTSEVKATGVVSESEHQRFEKKYTELCIKGQQSNPDSPVKDDQMAGSLCECMAKAVSKRLSKAEAVHFLDKKEMPIELVMMGNAASDICAQPQK